MYVLFWTTFSDLYQNGNEQGGGMIEILIPLRLFSMFCFLYTIYFVAKTFKTAELQKEVDFGDFAGEFFMIFFYFIRIWVFQPEINKMVESESTIADNV